MKTLSLISFLLFFAQLGWAARPQPGVDRAEFLTELGFELAIANPEAHLLEATQHMKPVLELYRPMDIRYANKKVSGSELEPVLDADLWIVGIHAHLKAVVDIRAASCDSDKNGAIIWFDLKDSDRLISKNFEVLLLSLCWPHEIQGQALSVSVAAYTLDGHNPSALESKVLRGKLRSQAAPLRDAMVEWIMKSMEPQ
jgi:hypothetical protein